MLGKARRIVTMTLVNRLSSYNSMLFVYTITHYQCPRFYFFLKLVNSWTKCSSLSISKKEEREKRPCQQCRVGLGDCLSRHVLLILLCTISAVQDLAKQQDSPLINQTAAGSRVVKCHMQFAFFQLNHSQLPCFSRLYYMLVLDIFCHVLMYYMLIPQPTFNIM